MTVIRTSAAILSVLGLLGGLTVASIIWRKRQLHQPKYFILLNLTVSDTSLAVVLLILLTYTYYVPTLTCSIPFVARLVIYFLIMASLGSNFMLMLDRYLAIRLCLRYYSFTTGHVQILIIALWSVCIALTGVIYSMSRKDYGYGIDEAAVGTYILSTVLVAMFIMNRYVMKTRCLQLKRIGPLSTALPGETVERIHLLKKCVRSIKEVRCLHYFSLLNILVLLIYNVFVLLHRHDYLHIFTKLVSVMIVFTLFLNPLVYVMTMSELRKITLHELTRLVTLLRRYVSNNE